MTDEPIPKLTVSIAMDGSFLIEMTLSVLPIQYMLTVDQLHDLG